MLKPEQKHFGVICGEFPAALYRWICNNSAQPESGPGLGLLDLIFSCIVSTITF